MRKIKILAVVIMLMIAFLLICVGCELQKESANTGVYKYVREDGEEITINIKDSFGDYNDGMINGYYKTIKSDLIDLAAYKEICADTIGIIRIADTVLNHPLVQTKDNEGYYLRRELTGKYNSHGTPFLSADNSFESQGENLVIYGHNIGLNGRNYDVFGELRFYVKQDYYEKHKYIETVSSSGTRKWEICAVYLINTAEDNTFKYSEYTNFQNEDSWKTWKKNIDKRNKITYDGEMRYGDTFITLSTCYGTNTDGTSRMAVTAKLVNW